MKKWVIKQPTKGAPLEIWEYIDTIKEAMEYWYIAQAIRKYGADKIVPLAMNDYGGYHPLPADSKEIVQIVTSEKRPDISVFQQYPTNTEQIYNGWMSPSGTTFECGIYGHIGCADKLCREFHVPEIGTVHGDEALLEQGWIKISNRKWFGRWGQINDYQLRTLEKLHINPLTDMRKGGITI